MRDSLGTEWVTVEKPEPSMTPIPPIPEDLREMYESAKLDSTMFVGSQIRQLIGRIAKLTAEVEHAKGYAGRMFLAVHPQCTLLPDLMGVLTQIDNALTAIPKLEAENTRLKEEVEHAYKSGFEDCRSQALYIVDESEGYSSRIDNAQPSNPRATRTPPQEGQ